MLKEYTINGESYSLNLFDKITCSEEAYLIGYLCGDGGYNAPSYKRIARLYVCSADETVITKFQKYFCPNNSINSKIPINKTRNIIATKPIYSLNFNSKFSEVFNKYGILAKKVDRKCINIPKKFMNAYLLGLFDADGCITWGFRKDRNRLWASFQVTHCSLDVLSKIQKYLVSEWKINSIVTKRKTENCYDLKISEREVITELYCRLYEDTTCLFGLSRKKDHYLKFVEEYLQSY